MLLTTCPGENFISSMVKSTPEIINPMHDTLALFHCDLISNLPDDVYIIQATGCVNMSWFVSRLAQIIILLFATAIFLSYAIQFYVPLEILLPAAKARFPRHETLVDYGLRYGFVLVTCKFQ